MLELLDRAINVIQENSNDFQSFGCSGSGFDCYIKTSLLASFRSFVCCPIFVKRGNENALDVFYDAVIQSMERLLKALVKLYEQFSGCVRNSDSDPILSELPVSDALLQISGPLDSNNRIVDMELDVNEDVNDVDILTIGGKIATGVSFSAVKWKLSMISLISSFFFVLDSFTWGILYELMGKECDTKVYHIIVHICYFLL